MTRLLWFTAGASAACLGIAGLAIYGGTRRVW